MNHKDFEIDWYFKMHMSRRLFLIVTAITWLWTIFSFFYTIYVATTGFNPIIDWMFGLQTNATSFFGVSSMWAMVIFGLVLWIVSLVAVAIISGHRRSRKKRR